MTSLKKAGREEIMIKKWEKDLTDDRRKTSWMRVPTNEGTWI